jgi:hypothetical protein
MLDFREPVLGDRERIEAFVRESGQIGCDITFTNTYLWRNHYDIRVAFDGESYYKSYFTAGQPMGYAFPMTRGDIRTAIGNILDDARARGAAPLIGLLNDANAAVIEELYGDRVTIRHDRDAYDYLYERQNLARLSGKKYHSKRNHISRYWREHEDSSVEEICERNFDDVLSVTERWIARQDEDTGELAVIRDALEHFDELGLFGLLLYAGGRAVAMTFGSRISDEVCDVNFEKAVEIDSAYAVINNAFAKRYDTFTYLNREEDLGLDGLRKSKLSYHPDILLRKSSAFFK